MKHANFCTKAAGFFVIIVLLYSCSTTHVVTKYDCNTVANNPAYSKTTWTFAWGLVQPKDIDPKCDASFNHMNGVTVKNNLGYAIITVATLGIVMPQKVSWCCAPPEPKTKTLGTK